MGYTLTKAEQETTVNWCADSRTAFIDSADPVVMRKLDKLVEEYPDVYKCVKVDTFYQAKWYEVDSRYIRFAKPASEKVKEAARAKIANMPKKDPDAGRSEEVNQSKPTLARVSIEATENGAAAEEETA